VRHLHDQVNCLYGLRAQHPTIIQHLLNAIQEITKDMEHILQSQLDLDTCHAHLGSLMTLNHSLLTSLGVSHPTIDKIINVSQSHAAFCKMTGAGGGGCLIMLLPLTPADTLKDILRNMSCSLFSVKLGGSGIKVQ
jgi:mevalonate kinase